MTATSIDRDLAVRGLLYVIAAGVIWGTIGPAIALVNNSSNLSAFTVTAYRSVLAVVVLTIAVTIRGQVDAAVHVVRTQRGRVVTVGLLTATFQLLFFIAVIGAGVSVATVVMLGFAPVLLLILTSVRQRRLPPGPQALTVGTALLGLTLVALVGESGPRPDGIVWGLAAALGSGTAYALSAEIAPPLTQNHGAVPVTTATMSVAALFLVPIGLISGTTGSNTLIPESPRVWLLILYLGVFTMAVAYVLLFAGLRTTPSSVAVVATLIEPVTAVAIAVAFLGEALTPVGVLGAALILASIASLGVKREPQPQ